MRFTGEEDIFGKKNKAKDCCWIMLGSSQVEESSFILPLRSSLASLSTVLNNDVVALLYKLLDIGSWLYFV